MAHINVPQVPDLAQVDLAVSTGHKQAKEGKGEVQRQSFSAQLPKSIGDAVAHLGEEKVYRLFINAYVVELQGEERQKLQPKLEGKERKKAPYLQQLGL